MQKTKEESGGIYENYFKTNWHHNCNCRGIDRMRKPEQAAQVAEIITEDIAVRGDSVEDAVFPPSEDRGGAH